MKGKDVQLPVKFNEVQDFRSLVMAKINEPKEKKMQMAGLVCSSVVSSTILANILTGL